MSNQGSDEAHNAGNFLISMSARHANTATVTNAQIVEWDQQEKKL